MAGQLPAQPIGDDRRLVPVAPEDVSVRGEIGVGTDCHLQEIVPG